MEAIQEMLGMSATPIVKVLRQGDTTKNDPFTIIIVSNPVLETPWKSGKFAVDPVTSRQLAFDASAANIVDALFGLLPGQKEQFMADPRIGPAIRVISLFVNGLAAVDSNSLVAEDGLSDTLVARRSAFVAFLTRYGYKADIVYAVSQSDSHTRASAWYTSDDDGGSGVPFDLDGVTYMHRFYCRIPGTVAIHTTSSSITPLHEFGHALSSYSNGSVTDLYVDSDPALNNKVGRPVPRRFCTYNGSVMSADATRNGLSYPASWLSYHCELHDPRYPAVMDDYWSASSGRPEDCQHDKVTRQFLIDRLIAKISR
jgi:hypothetical protein